MSRITQCPVCDGSRFTDLVEIPDAPVFCNVLHADRDQARSAATGTIALAACDECSHIVNLAFDDSELTYSADYENSLHHSPTFQEFAVALAAGLVADYKLAGRQVVELGCGKGDFLAMLARAGGTESIGFDPSYAGGVDTYRGPGSVTVFADTFQAAGRGLRPALVVSRHVLEHLSDPGALLAGLAQFRGSDPAVYLEVPNADYMVEHEAVWDVIYEHPSHFTAQSLCRLCRRHGLTPTRVETTFGDQFLSAHARFGDHPPAPVTAPADPRAFGRAVADLRANWEARLAEERAAGHRVAIWGAGSKGVSFVALVDSAADEVELAVDLNPAKQGRFLPASGVEVAGPDDPRLRDISLVLAMNPRYEDEIRADLRARDLRALVEVV